MLLSTQMALLRPSANIPYVGTLKISILDYLISANCILLFNENDEHAKCLNVWFCFLYMVTMYACFTSKHLSFLCVYVHGASFSDR